MSFKSDTASTPSCAHSPIKHLQGVKGLDAHPEVFFGGNSTEQAVLLGIRYFGSSVSERVFNKQKTMQTKKLEKIVVSFLKIF